MKMKKIALSMAGVLAAIAFAPEASAVPVFARQTGMACAACHFQHFPLLNAFGRSFKASGFTLMGSQGKVEGENLAIPDRLNMGVLATAFWQNASNTGGGVNAVNTAGTKWGVPGNGGELSIFYGGRIADYAGFLSELGLTNGAAGTGAAKLPLLWEVGNSRVGIVTHTSGGQGAAYSFELLNTGAANTHKLMGNNGPRSEHVKAFSASQYFGTNTAATGVHGVWVNPDMGFVNVGMFSPTGTATAGANTLPLTYVRAAGFFNLAGFDAAVGVQNFSGDLKNLTGALTSYKATIIDAQMQGELAGKGFGLYASYGTAPNDTVGGNAFNPSNAAAGAALLVPAAAATCVGCTSASSFNVAAEWGVIPHGTVQVALRSANTGAAVNAGDNAIMIGATYDLAMNLALGVNVTQQSGSSWNVGGANYVAGANGGQVGKTAATVLLEALF